MVRIFFATTTFMAVAFFKSHAQSEALPNKQFSHYIGVQANQLIKQIVNLNSGSSSIDNPYLLVYSIKDNKTGWGAAAGIGYEFQKIHDLLPENRESKMNNLFFRAGVTRKSMVSKRFEASYGLDFVYDYRLNKTFTSSVTVFGSSIDSSESIVTSKTTSYGFGPQFTISYYFSERLLLGTETTYYFISSSEKQNAITTDKVFSQFPTPETVTTTSNSNSKTDVSTFTFGFPVALFLILKF